MALVSRIVPIALLVAGCLAGGPTGAAPDPHQAHAQEHTESPELRAMAARSVGWRHPQAANPRSWIRFKVLGINDFHGQLEPRSLSGRPVGGAAVLASYLEAATAEAPDGALLIHAGDHVGASPPVSALLQDEPAIGFLNLLANRHCSYRFKLHPLCNVVGTLGNHEFDEGTSELLRLLEGGNHEDGPFQENPWRGARYPTVSANVVWSDSGKPLLPRSVVKRVRGLPVAVIGAVLRETPTIVTPSGVAGLEFLNEAEAINAEVGRLRRQGVRAIVVALHQGTRQNPSSADPTPTAPVVLDGAIGEIVRRLDDEVDLVVSGHAHSFTNALMENGNGTPILVTQAFSASTAYGDIDLAIDPRSRDIVQKSARILTTWADEGPGLSPDPEVAALVADAANTVAPLVDRVVGTAATAITRTESPAGESALGNLIADAQRAAMDTEIALMNPGGIRADLAAGEVTWGALFTVQPFGNDLVRMTLTGAQIVALLNQQWEGQPFARILKPAGLTYAWRENGAGFADNRVDPASILVNGAPLDPLASYSVTVNSFLAGGGDNFTVLTQGTDRVVGPTDLDALITHIENLPQPFGAGIEGRIAALP
ncbi:MAG: bifunctional metallophosphatase/5'-nucleotidase [Pseudomonadales bacterium]|nr:bifunctional metallophosphatase/5'-nucleotidase [Pseudomonadales bacterium]